MRGDCCTVISISQRIAGVWTSSRCWCADAALWQRERAAAKIVRDQSNWHVLARSSFRFHPFYLPASGCPTTRTVAPISLKFFLRSAGRESLAMFACGFRSPCWSSSRDIRGHLYFFEGRGSHSTITITCSTKRWCRSQMPDG